MTQQPGAAADRCPSCGARVPEGAEWCSLCLADLRPAPAAPLSPPVPPAASARPAVPAPPPPADLPAAAAGAPRRGAIDAPPPTGPPVVLGDVPLPGTGPLAGTAPVAGMAPVAGTGPAPEVGDAMLAELAAAERAARPAVLERFSTRGARIGLMVGGTVALALLLVVVVWLLGAVFGRG